MLHYETHGSPDDPAVCFLHGFMGSHAVWTSVIDALAPDTYCIAVDLPGHGASVRQPAHVYTMEGIAQSLADVLDEVGVRRSAFVGYSMGGRAALYMAAFHPGFVTRLVLESATPGLRTDPERVERQYTDAQRAAAITADLNGFLHDWYRMPLFASLQMHGLVDEVIRMRRNNDPIELAKALRGYGTGQQPSLWERLPTLQIPTLALTGALDDKYVGITRQMAAAGPRVERAVVPEAGHNVHLERPQAFVAHLVRFLLETVKDR